jgi:AmiR/NasT family two-component response regulator
MAELIEHDDWSGGGRGRVLVEATEWRMRSSVEAMLRQAGYDTVGCTGPEGSGQRCTLAAESHCAAAETADVVVHTLRTSDLRNLEALRALRRRCPDTPIIIEAPAVVAAERREDFAGCVVIEAPLDAVTLLRAVDQAMESP